MTQLWIIAGVTFREAARRKILWTALLAAAAFLALFGTGMHFQVKDSHFARIPPMVRYQALSSILQVGFYAIDMLAVLMTVSPAWIPSPVKSRLLQFTPLPPSPFIAGNCFSGNGWGSRRWSRCTSR